MIEGPYYIVGLGRTGLGTARFLKARHIPFVVWDDNEEARMAFDKALPGQSFEDPAHHAWTHGESLLLSPGIPHELPAPHCSAQKARQAGIPIIVDLEIFCELHAGQIILGITGTNGKSTTTALVHHILVQAGYDAVMGGNIGVPILSLPLHQIYVLELSSYQLERMTTRALSGALLLNITPDHLERHGTMESYQATKGRIFGLLNDKGVGVVAMDDSHSVGLYNWKKKDHSLIPFSLDKKMPGGIYLEGSVLINHLGAHPYRVIDLATVPYLKGRHNYQNIMGAYALLKETFSWGIEDEVFCDGLKTFRGLAHRQEYVLTTGSLTFINDSKATNMESALPALAAYDNLYWIVGGMAKTATIDIEMVRPYASKIRRVYTYGRDREIFARDLGTLCTVNVASTLEEVTKAAYEDARAAGEKAVILLSPASASWDQFQSFEHRGDAFKKLVHDLVGKNDG